LKVCFKIETRSHFSSFSTSTPNKKLAVSDIFKDIIEKAKLKVLLSSPMPTDAELSEIMQETITTAVQSFVEPLVTKLENMDIKLNTIQHVGTNGIPVQQKLNGFFSFRPPPPFSGGIGESYDEFFDRLQQYMLMQGIDGTGVQDNRFQLAYLENNLSGAALATFKELRKKPNMQDFASVAAGMKTAFQEGRDSDVYQQIIHDRKQKRTESVIEYFNALKTLSLAAYPDLDEKARESIIKITFSRGLLNEIRQALRLRVFKQLSDLVRTAQFIESQIAKDSLYDSTKPAISVVRNQQTNFSEIMSDQLSRRDIQQIFDRLKALERRQPLNQASQSSGYHKCAFCNKFGSHSADDCTRNPLNSRNVATQTVDWGSSSGNRQTDESRQHSRQKLFRGQYNYRPNFRNPSFSSLFLNLIILEFLLCHGLLRGHAHDRLIETAVVLFQIVTPQLDQLFRRILLKSVKTVTTKT